MRLLEANFGKAKKPPEEEEIWVQLWVSALGMFDLATLKRQAVAACHKFKFWPSLAEFRALCVEDRKDLNERAGYVPPRARFEQPKEHPQAIAERQRDAALRRRVRELMAKAGEAPIDWNKPHDKEFARQAPFVARAKKEMGYVG